MKKLLALTGLLSIALSSLVQAVPIYTQTLQGGYSTNQLTGSRWSAFTSMVSAQHTINQYGDFTQALGNTVWVDQEYGGGLTAAEQTNLRNFYNSGNTEALVILDSNWVDDTYINQEDNRQFAQNIVDWLLDTNTKKMVLIGENSGWTNWNNTLMNIVDGGYTPACSRATGSPTSSHALTSGIQRVENVCGSYRIDANQGNPDILFSNSFAAVYSSNVVDVDVDEPGTFALLLLGLAGLGFARRKVL